MTYTSLPPVLPRASSPPAVLVLDLLELHLDLNAREIIVASGVGERDGGGGGLGLDGCGGWRRRWSGRGGGGLEAEGHEGVIYAYIWT